MYPHHCQKKGLIPVPTPDGGILWVHPHLIEGKCQWTTVSHKKSKGKGKVKPYHVVWALIRRGIYMVVPFWLGQYRCSGRWHQNANHCSYFTPEEIWWCRRCSFQFMRESFQSNLPSQTILLQGGACWLALWVAQKRKKLKLWTTLGGSGENWSSTLLFIPQDDKSQPGAIAHSSMPSKP